MKVKRTTITTIIVSILIFAMVTSIYAQRGAREQQKYMKSSQVEIAEMDKGHHPCFEDLDLTDAQKDQLYELKTKLDKDMNDYDHRLNNVKIELRDLLKKEDITTAKNKIDEIMDIKSEMWKRRLDFRADFMKILTDEQKKKLGDFPFVHWAEGMIGKDGRRPYEIHRRMHK